MTLDQWIALSPQQRNRRRRRWRPRSGYWIALIEEAHRRFKHEFEGHPLVNDVQFTVAYSEGQEPEIQVTTALWAPQVVEDLPDRYCTFRVTQRPNKDRKHRYLSLWVLVLGKLLRWPKSKVHKWAWEHHAEVLNCVGLYANHYDILDYVTPLLVPKRLQRRLPSSKMVELKKRLALAIECWDADAMAYKHSPTIAGYDWTAARARIRRVLSDYEP